MTETLIWCTHGVIFLILATIVYTDWQFRTIRNKAIVAIFVCAIVLKVLGGHSLLEWGLSTSLGTSVLLAGFVAFALRLLGGGDAKLLAVLVFTKPNPPEVVDFILVTALAGGSLAAAYHLKLIRQLNDKSGIPYGIALCAGYYGAYAI
jgi:prepilin peptidase CpaA